MKCFLFKELRPALNVQSVSIRAKVFNLVLIFMFNLVFNQLLIISSFCMILLSFYTSKNFMLLTRIYIYIHIFVVKFLPFT